MSKNENKYRINTFIPRETAQYLKAYADKFGITMGGAIAIIVHEQSKLEAMATTFKSINEDREKAGTDLTD